MRSFRVFYNESIEQWSATNLGLSKSVNELPDTAPYGFWVDRHGNFLTVEPYGHEEGAEHIIAKAKVPYDYRKEHPYDKVMDQGFIRVVLFNNKVRFNTKRKSGRKATNPQLKFLKYVNDIYELEGLKET